jgi:hypothetical protein
MSRDEHTYDDVRHKYDRWVDSEAARPPRAHLRRDNPHPAVRRGESDTSRLVFAAVGIGLGVVLLALAGYAFYTASYWAGFGRDGAQVGYIVVGVFLLVAGLGGIVATYNHNFRVLVRPPPPH